ncbi:hypothetical protein AcV7_003921 [Taiwanofungus camphoratus]|nr:hypothetical protein AcV7_003921 [Antrodia cinnamomea]
MDGRCMGCSLTLPGHDGSRWGVRTDAEVRQPYQFAPLVLTDNDSVANPDGSGNDNLGVIEVRVRRATIRRRGGSHGRPKYRVNAIPERGPIHERSKKAGVHCVSLGEGIRCAPHKHRYKVNCVDPVDRPLIRFVFRYRPKELLQAQGIIPLDVPSHASSSGGTSSNRRGRKRKLSLSSSVVNACSLSKRQRRSSVKAEVKPDPQALGIDNDIVIVESDPSQSTPTQSRFGSSRKVKKERTRTLLHTDVIDLTED